MFVTRSVESTAELILFVSKNKKATQGKADTLEYSIDHWMLILQNSPNESGNEYS